MIILDTATKGVEAKLAAAVATTALPFSIHYVETLDTDQSVFDIGSADGTITGTGVAVLLTGPPAGHTRTVKALFIPNVDTTGATVTLQLNNAGTTRQLNAATLTAGDNLEYTD
jgi:hypothetical protein